VRLDITPGFLFIPTTVMLFQTSVLVNFVPDTSSCKCTCLLYYIFSLAVSKPMPKSHFKMQYHVKCDRIFH
jgi:hypothetical protein